jgi:hypothetical protein
MAFAMASWVVIDTLFTFALSRLVVFPGRETTRGGHIIFYDIYTSTQKLCHTGSQNEEKGQVQCREGGAEWWLRSLLHRRKVRRGGGA